MRQIFITQPEHFTVLCFTLLDEAPHAHTHDLPRNKITADDSHPHNANVKWGRKGKRRSTDHPPFFLYSPLKSEITFSTTFIPFSSPLPVKGEAEKLKEEMDGWTQFLILLFFSPFRTFLLSTFQTT